MQEEARHYRQRLDNPQSVHDIDDALAAIYRFPSVTAAAVASGSMESECQLRIESVERFSGDIAKVRTELDTVGLGYDVFIVCPTEAEVERLREIFGTTQLAASGKLHFPIGRLQSGFRLVSDRIVLVSSGELFHRTDLARPTGRRLGRIIDSFLELRGRSGRPRRSRHRTVSRAATDREGGVRRRAPGAGIRRRHEDFRAGFEDRAGAKVRRRHQKAAAARPHWRESLGAAEAAGQQAVTDMASDLLELQALRAARPGISFAVESEWQHEFEAAFPYTETPDQRTAIEAIKSDMLRPQPIDRLMCGDVGYGKTELAMRAAFRAVDNGYQVAVLVPTTMLAEQHFRTFSERMAEYPFRIDRLSRFGTKRQQAAIIRRCQAGSVDIVIGTHRLAQADVTFHNLGLLMIDEEQRFGVEVKERLKAPAANGRCADAHCHADSAHVAHVAAGPARYLQPGDAAGRSTGGRNARRAVRSRARSPRRAARAEPRRPGVFRAQPRGRHRAGRPPAARDRARGLVPNRARRRCTSTTWSG